MTGATVRRAGAWPRAAARGLALAAVAGLAGCGGGPPPPADKREGVAVLRAALEAWQAGETPAGQAAKAPPVTVVDPAWDGGAKLARFEIDEADARPAGYDLSCQVRLWLGDGKKPPARVRYVVALSPARVVTREFGG